jgi:hypothetical protein
MHLNGTNQLVKITLRNPLDHKDQLTYSIKVYDNSLADDWVLALKKLLVSGNLLEKNFCFMGFPNSPRTLEFLCKELNQAIYVINTFNSNLRWINAGLESYFIEDYYTPDVVRFSSEYPIGERLHKIQTDDTYLLEHIGLAAKKQVLNRLHNHFEILQGTVESLSPYYIEADYETKYAIRQLNIICHEIENLILSQQKQAYLPQFIRPSQINTWLHADRYTLKDQHRDLFVANGYNRQFGHVYMHWTQIGKTLFEVFRDEGAPKLDATICDAITQLQYYSGEFDIEWGSDMIYGNKETYWFTDEQDIFKQWLIENGLDPQDKNLSLGYLPIGEVDLEDSFGTTDMFKVWDLISAHLDVFKITVDDISQTFDYCWTDADYKQQQIKMMRPGYDYSSRG